MLRLMKNIVLAAIVTMFFADSLIFADEVLSLTSVNTQIGVKRIRRGIMVNPGPSNDTVTFAGTTANPYPKQNKTVIEITGGGIYSFQDWHGGANWYFWRPATLKNFTNDTRGNITSFNVTDSLSLTHYGDDVITWTVIEYQ